jgi:hypothetical protein
MEYYSVTKKNKVISVAGKMGETGDPTKENKMNTKDKYHIFTHMLI